MNKRFEVTRTKDNKVIGKIINDVFTKSIKKSRHFMKYPPGISLDVYIFQKLKEKEVKLLVIEEREEQKVYFSTIENFEAHSTSIDYGHGEQLLLPLEYWSVQLKIEYVVYKRRLV